MDSSLLQAQSELLRQLDHVHPQQMLGTWKPPEQVTEKPVVNGIHSSYPDQTMLRSNDGTFQRWYDVMSHSHLPEEIKTNQRNLLFNNKRFALQMMSMRGYVPPYLVAERDDERDHKEMVPADLERLGGCFACYGQENDVMVKLGPREKTFLFIERPGNWLTRRVELNEPACNVWWMTEHKSEGERDADARILVQTHRGLHVLGVLNRQMSPRKATEKRPTGWNECCSPSKEGAPLSLIKSFRLIHRDGKSIEGEEYDEAKKCGVYHVSSFSFASVQRQFPSQPEEEEPAAHQEWFVSPVNSSKTKLFLQPPRSNQLVYLECGTQGDCPCVLRGVCSLQMKGVTSFVEDPSCREGEMGALAFHKAGFLLAWRHDRRTQEFSSPALMSHPMVLPPHEDPACPRGDDGLRLLHMRQNERGEGTYYFTRGDEQHTHLWRSVRSFPAPGTDGNEKGSPKDAEGSNNGFWSANGSKRRKLAHLSSVREEEQRRNRAVQKIRYLWENHRSLDRIKNDPFLLPELLVNAMSWETLWHKFPSPYTRKVAGPYRQLLRVEPVGLSERFLQLKCTYRGNSSEFEKTPYFPLDVHTWEECCVRLLQKVRSAEAILKEPLSEDTGLFFAAWRHLFGNPEVGKQLMEWVREVGPPPQERFDQNLSEERPCDPATFVQEAVWKPESFRLCMCLHVYLSERFYSSTRYRPDPLRWEGLESFHPSVWKMVWGEPAYAHLRRFYEEGERTVFGPLLALSDIAANVKSEKRYQDETSECKMSENEEWLHRHKSSLTKVFRTVVKTKAECWTRMSMLLDQEQKVVDACVPDSVRDLCSEMDERILEYLYQADHVQWKKDFSTHWHKGLCNATWIFQGGECPTRSLAEMYGVDREKTNGFHDSFPSTAPGTKVQRLHDWKQGRLGTGMFLDEWYAYFVETLPEECLVHCGHMGLLFRTFTFLRLTGGGTVLF